ncbi:hypothetical protein ColTof4_07983 [Colletotrichum tofieldiae]|nr:hypothetical protein ColTof3_02495 [Colletotrichum tofieldiae]GKT75560.1 hypothetical protein ColTof4_07983 [Colletotrichum tofieldiae]GKT83238.1 hypothetical protein Ct61P_01088 [Colletotrichum tofieldiae]
MVEVTTGLANGTNGTNETLSRQQASYEASRLGSHTERDANDGTIFEKADIDEDEDIPTGGQSKRQEAASGTVANQGEELHGMIHVLIFRRPTRVQ